MQLTTLTGLLLIVVPITFNVTFFMLQRAFEYPDILRKPTGYILQRFKDGGTPLRRLWYAFALSAMLFTPFPSWSTKYLGPTRPGFSSLAR